MSTTFGKRVLKARLSLSARLGRQVTQAEIGERMGVTGVTVSRWEADQKEPTLDTITRLAAVLGVEPSWLAFDDAQTSTPREVDVPQPNPLLDQRISDEEIRAARAQMAARKRPAAKKANGRHHGRG